MNSSLVELFEIIMVGSQPNGRKTDDSFFGLPVPLNHEFFVSLQSLYRLPLHCTLFLRSTVEKLVLSNVRHLHHPEGTTLLLFVALVDDHSIPPPLCH